MFRSSKRVIWAACFLAPALCHEIETDGDIAKQGPAAPNSNSPLVWFDKLGRPYGLEGVHVIILLVLTIVKCAFHIVVHRMKWNKAKEGGEAEAVDYNEYTAQEIAEARQIARSITGAKGGPATESIEAALAKGIAQKVELTKDSEAIRYVPDETAEVLLSTDPDVWVECKIVGLGSTQANHYNIEIDPGASQDAYFYEGQTLEVSVKSLRKLSADTDKENIPANEDETKKDK